MAVKSLHHFFYYRSKYLNSMKCREIIMGPSIRIIQCSSLVQKKKLKKLKKLKNYFSSHKLPKLQWINFW
jgi:hypothetical protein